MASYPTMGDLAAMDAYGNDMPPDADAMAVWKKYDDAQTAHRMGGLAEQNTYGAELPGYDAAQEPTTPQPTMLDALQFASAPFLALAKKPGDVFMGRTPVTDYSGETSADIVNWGRDAALQLATGGMARAPEGAFGAFGGRMRQPPRRSWDEPLDTPPPAAGHNMPPEEMALAKEPSPRMGGLAEVPPKVPPAIEPAPPPEKTWLQGLPRPKPVAQSTDIPNIRGLPVDEAIDIARTQPHLVKSGDRSEGLYVGGPRDIQTKQQLNRQRDLFDQYLSKDTRGWDWYDRYRGALNETTGGDPARNRWASAQQGQWSAGVDPGSELHFALKENNASIAGMPVKAARPAQHEAHLAALAANDPSLYQLGDKTGEYASKVNPDQLLPPGATGVNDFRHARNFAYTEPDGSPQKGALGDAGHRFLDMETALAVDRANKANLGGRSDWTGERLQATPWVSQKAGDLMSRNKNLTYDDAFLRANRTIGDYYPDKTYYATHEAQPGADVVGHMPGGVNAAQAEKDAFYADPRSTWATAPGARDAIYSGLGVPGTDSFMRVRPTVPMQGMYPRPDGQIETNPGDVARPLGTFTVGAEGTDEPFKRATDADRAILNAGEGLRAYVDAQNAGAWHKLWFGGPVGESNTLFYPGTGKAALGDLFSVQGTNTPHGLPDVADTGGGITSTRFWPTPEGGNDFDKAFRKGEMIIPGLEKPRRARLDSDMLDYVDAWKKGEGSGAATTQLLTYINKTPGLRESFNQNPYLAEQALGKYERDKDWAHLWGAPREDIQNARKIIGGGPGWVDRLEAALKTGAVSLPVVGALYAAAAHSHLQQQGGADHEGM